MKRVESVGLEAIIRLRLRFHTTIVLTQGADLGSHADRMHRYAGHCLSGRLDPDGQRPASGSAGNPLHAPYRLCHRRSELPPAEEAGGQDQPGTGAEAQLNNSHSTGRKESADRRAPFLLRPVRAEYGISSEKARRENSIGRGEHNLIC